MIDKEEEKIKTPPLSASPEAVREPIPAASAQEESCPPGPGVKHPMSKGEAWFEDFFYYKVNYWLNLGMSLLITDFFTHEGKGFMTRTGTGKRMLENGSKRLARLVEKTGVVAAGKALHSTRVGLKTLALNSGGWLLVLPLFFAERNKRAIVHWKNKQLGIIERAPDGHEKTAEEIHIVDEQPVSPGFGGLLKDAAKILGRRTLASGSTIVTGITLDKIATTKDPLTNETIHGQERITNLIKDMTNNAVKISKVPGHQAFVKSDFVQRYLGFAALDTIYTYMTATVMYLTSGSHKKKKAQEAEEQSLVSAEAKAATEIPKEQTPPAKFQDRLQAKPESHASAVSNTPDNPMTLGV